MKRIKRLGEMLIDAGVINEEQLKKALEIQKKNGKRLGSILLEQGWATEDDILKVLSEQYGNVPVAKSKHLQNIPEDVIKLVPPHIAARYDVIPVAKKGNNLFLAMVNPGDHFAVEDVRFVTKMDVVPLIALEENIRDAIKKYYKVEDMMDQLVKVEDEDLDIEVIGGEKEIEKTGEAGLIEGKTEVGAVEKAGEKGEIQETLEDLIISGEMEEIGGAGSKAEEEEAEDITAITDEKSPIVKLVNVILYE